MGIETQGQAAPQAVVEENKTEQLNTIVEQEAKKEPMSDKYAEMARKEKAQRMRDRMLMEREAALKAKEEEISKYKSLDSRLAEDPFAVLEEKGLTYDKLTEMLLSKGDPTAQTIAKLEKKIAELESGQKQTLNKFEETQKQQYEDAKKQIRQDVMSIAQSSEDFALIKEMEAYDFVVEEIEKEFNANGRLMSVEEAAAKVENELIEEAMRYAKLSKIQSKLAPKPVEEPVEEKQQMQVQKPQINTLSNRMVQSTTKPLTPSERRQRAIAAFQGKLT